MALQKAGVELVVEGLAAFTSNIGKANSSLKQLDTSGNAISRTIEGVTSFFGGLGQSMLRVAEVALGVLVRDAFLAVINGLKSIIAATIEAGAEFQTLELRLRRLNLNALMESGQDFTTAMKGAIKMTKEQMTWLQKLAVTTPYDNQDIANVFTLARSYGFAADEAKGLTQDIIDFASGMGLGNQEIERIIINFGQMVQQGKVNARELNDLARGSFVPVNDVLDMMREKTGLSGKAFDKFRMTGKGVALFMEAFSNLVKQRFGGAAKDMARTFQGATANTKDLVKSLLGLGIVTPILDTIGGKIADFIDALTAGGNWDTITSAISFFSGNLNSVFRDILNMGPDVSSVADKIAEAFDRWGIWIAQNKDMIINSIRNIIDLFKTGDFKGPIFGLTEDSPFIKALLFIRDFLPSVQNIIDLLKTGDFKGGIFGLEEDDPFITALTRVGEIFNTLSTWVDENGPTMKLFFETLGEIVSTVFENLTGKEIETGGLQGVLDSITTFMEYVIENKDQIAEWVTNLVRLWITLQLIGFVFSIILPPILTFIGTILSIVAVIGTLIAIVSLLVNPLFWIVVIFGLLGLAVGALIGIFLRMREHWQENVQIMTDKAIELKEKVVGKFKEMGDSIINFLKELGPRLSEAGKKVMEGFINGIKSMGTKVIGAIKEVVEKAIAAVLKLLGEKSPSTVFIGIGKNMMKGLALGIESLGSQVSGVMDATMAQVAMPAVYASAQLGGQVSTTNTYTNNYNLTVNSSAPSEPIIQDYNMLQALAGSNG